LLNATLYYFIGLREFFDLAYKLNISIMKAVFIRHQASGIRHQASGIRHQASGIRHQASGIRRQASGVCLF